MIVTRRWLNNCHIVIRDLKSDCQYITVSWVTWQLQPYILSLLPLLQDKGRWEGEGWGLLYIPSCFHSHIFYFLISYIIYIVVDDMPFNWQVKQDLIGEVNASPIYKNTSHKLMVILLKKNDWENRCTVSRREQTGFSRRKGNCLHSQ